MNTRMEGLRRAAERIPTESADDRRRRYARMFPDEKRVEARKLLSALAEDHPVRVYGEHVLRISPHATDEERRVLAEEFARAKLAAAEERRTGQRGAR